MLTARQKAFVENFVTCRVGALAARRAGYAAPSARITACRLLAKANIQAALAVKEAELERLAKIDKNRVITEIMEGINIAKLQANAGNVIGGWVQIGKMLGHYAPEVKSVEQSVESDVLRVKFSALSDQELIEIAEGRAVAI